MCASGEGSFTPSTGQAVSAIMWPTTRKWRSGSASPCQGEGRGFESRLPLQRGRSGGYCGSAPGVTSAGARTILLLTFVLTEADLSPPDPVVLEIHRAQGADRRLLVRLFHT